MWSCDAVDVDGDDDELVLPDSPAAVFEGDDDGDFMEVMDPSSSQMRARNARAFVEPTLKKTIPLEEFLAKRRRKRVTTTTNNNNNTNKNKKNNRRGKVNGICFYMFAFFFLTTGKKKSSFGAKRGIREYLSDDDDDDLFIRDDGNDHVGSTLKSPRTPVGKKARTKAHTPTAPRKPKRTAPLRAPLAPPLAPPAVGTTTTKNVHFFDQLPLGFLTFAVNYGPDLRNVNANVFTAWSYELKFLWDSLSDDKRALFERSETKSPAQREQ